MRRLVLSIIMASGLVVVGAGSASAEPVPTTGTAKPVPGKKVCRIEDQRLTALSGMVATKGGFVVVNDGVALQSGRKIFFLDQNCRVVKTTSFSGNGPRDTEDMVLSADGKTLWIADIGDNQRDRTTVGLWSMPADGSRQPKIHRLRYPQGEQRDAEALLVNGDGTPIIVTKEVSKPAVVFVPAGPLKTENTEGVPLRAVGKINVPASDTPAEGIVSLGRGSIDGGAVAPGGAKVVLRTYTDALEFAVTGGDVLAALKTTPRVTPLPNEPFGEAITYSADGKTFLTVSDMDNLDPGTPNWVLRYTPVAAAPSAKSTPAKAKASNGQSWFDKLTLDDITYLVGGVGLLGAVLVGLGVVGIVRSRRRPPQLAPKDEKGPNGPDPLGPDVKTALISPVRDDGRPAVDLQGAGHRGGGVYGGRPPVPQAGSGVYGVKPAGPPSGGVYGRQPAERPGHGVYGAPPATPPTRSAEPSAGPSDAPARPPGTAGQDMSSQGMSSQGMSGYGMSSQGMSSQGMSGYGMSGYGRSDRNGRSSDPDRHVDSEYGRAPYGR